jgi:predicted nuclease of predicted toxin-antitoxin system
MRFLVDESCDFAVVEALRLAGHEVTAVAEVSPRIDDSEVLDLAIRTGTVLITEDKDFGQLVYASARETEGVLLLRFPAGARSNMPAAVVDLVEMRGTELRGRFVVLQPGRVRLSGHEK